MSSKKRRHVLSIIADQFRSVVVLLLVVAGLLAIAFANHAEGVAIFAVIAINATIGLLTEWRATRSMEAFSQLGIVATLVMRVGRARQVPADQRQVAGCYTAERKNKTNFQFELRRSRNRDNWNR